MWTQHVGAFVPEPVEVSGWDQLLGDLGITEREALEAVILDRDIGRSIRRFVQDSFRDRFVPEDVLLAMNLQQRTVAFR
jgi:hypothetical protein